MLINYENQDYQELVGKDVVVVDFFATWCGPCQMLAPEFEKLANNMTDVTFVTVDIDKHRELAVNNQVRSVPTLVMFKDGKEVSRQSGFAPEAKLAEWIKANM